MNLFKLYGHFSADTRIQFLSIVKHLDLVELRIAVCGLVLISILIELSILSWPCPPKLQQFQDYTFGIISNKWSKDHATEEDATPQIALYHKGRLRHDLRLSKTHEIEPFR